MGKAGGVEIVCPGFAGINLQSCRPDVQKSTGRTATGSVGRGVFKIRAPVSVIPRILREGKFRETGRNF